MTFVLGPCEAAIAARRWRPALVADRGSAGDDPLLRSASGDGPMRVSALPLRRPFRRPPSKPLSKRNFAPTISSPFLPMIPAPSL
jgi:hypothetical protein